MGRPLKARATCSAASLPTGPATFTGRIRLAASAKYTAEPPSSSSTRPNGPSRVSSAIEPTTISSGTTGVGALGPPARAAARRDDMSRLAELLQKILRACVLLHLHPA